ncbi:unnamed protein product [Caenorhabditis bovis]|uniref:ZP domain-containing protein n=1 Tax=Caenorhabditis bovis TaxID=2654633 RepID=A0A8S1F5U6_9PELO|nr:unnamed protein product [Caenorhabditis bovis]
MLLSARWGFMELLFRVVPDMFLLGLGSTRSNSFEQFRFGSTSSGDLLVHSIVSMSIQRFMNRVFFDCLEEIASRFQDERSIGKFAFRWSPNISKLSSLSNPSQVRQNFDDTARFMHFLKILIIAWTGWRGANSISIDNEIIGQPDIECLEDEIRIFVKTRKIFAGRIYAKGRSDHEECYKDDFAKERTTKPHFDIQFGACGMKSLRSVDPRGMYYGITVVISFHPLFITKVDQAFHVKCFFEEASKGLTAELGVSMIPTTELEARHGIPGCSYTIHSSSIDEIDAGKPAGSTVQFARVGDKVLHQWHCNDHMFGVLINNCYVTDGFGKKSDVIDERGCPIDPILITGIRYSADLQRAYAESSVFKFADKPGVWFFCQVKMCMKKHGMCDGITPPSCGSVSKLLSHNGDEDDEDQPTRGKHPKKPPSDYDYDGQFERTTRRRTTTPDYDYNENESPKLHSSNSHSYNNAVTQSLDYDTATITAFSPPINPNPPSQTTTQESVSKTFETEDDLTPVTSEPKGKKIGKSDYNDYDEVTIPPNLTDLLANLPDDLSSDSIQKMLRDSVDDPKAVLEEFNKLLKQKKTRNAQKRNRSRNLRELKAGDLRSGEKIDQIEVDWTSNRRKDIPMEPQIGEDQKYVKPMIGGQLLIFDLDEEPPAEIKKDEPKPCSSLSNSSLFAIFAGFGGLLAALIAVIAFLLMRLNYRI